MEAFGTLADPYLSKLVNDMFTAVLSEDIFHCLHAITASVPSQQSGVENRLFTGSIALLAGTPNATGICDPRSKYRVVSLPEKIVSSSDRQEYTSKVILSLIRIYTGGSRALFTISKLPLHLTSLLHNEDFIKFLLIVFYSMSTEQD